MSKIKEKSLREKLLEKMEGYSYRDIEETLKELQETIKKKCVYQFEINPE